ncbi:MAG: ATP phosphoribosyltransferase regulatory subunit [Eubacteriales bacterium]|nr:ATP phosphoribosyltransferase regulatory subunit [Eubacteriales bacterium]
MTLDTDKLSKEDSVYFTLKDIYGRAGYTHYRLRKFEEYSLYLENMSFLTSESIITFNDADGKLLALKPDVTLSIVKNTKATVENGEKLYYRESVYRMDARTREYREICQAGVESMGGNDLYSTLEIIMLAAESLKAIDCDFMLNISHMGFIRGMLADCGITSEAVSAEITEYINAKNCHDLRIFAEKAGVPADKAESLIELISGKNDNDFENMLRAAGRLITGSKTAQAVAELEEIYAVIKDTPYSERIKLDFSIVSDMNYYNGIILRGYVRGVPKSVLSGGRYDKLMKRFNKAVGAMGFAINLSEVAAYYGTKPEYDADILLLYGNDDKPGDIFNAARQLRKSGGSVLAACSVPEGKKFKQIICLGDGNI